MNKPLISLIAALSENRVIGNKGEIPWKIPGEQKRFKDITTPHPVIMGRKTFESIGRLLPNRPNIIITGDTSYSVSDATITHSLPEAIKKATELDREEIFVIGGGKVFEEAISSAGRLYLTIVHTEVEGDAFFPEYSDFRNVVYQEDGETGGYRFTYITLER
nr:Dihydrofolate reductase [uncultured bacterium]AIA19273.1 Dihydrofolate reductase [uncultured bacterium]